jgi:RNA polymerase sigma-70 factor (ECF subfamily)
MKNRRETVFFLERFLVAYPERADVTEQTIDGTAELLARAQAGDGLAFGELTEPFRRELHVHCYRILGSVHDAEDVLQETMLAAWRGITRFEGRASLRFWLYRIATNQCLNALRGSGHRPVRPGQQPSAPEAQLAGLPAPATDSEPVWLEPYPDALLHDLPDAAPGPEARYEARESISLAFVAALQHLPARQRATLVLRDVLGYRAAETAGILHCSLDSVNSSLRRARAGLAAHVPAGGLHQAPLPGSATERDLLARVTDAFERGDVDALVAMLTEDARLMMPPSPFGFRGPAAAARVLTVLTFRGGTRRFRLLATRANGQPAFGCYAIDDNEPTAHAHGMMVLTLAGERIAGATRFHDNSLLHRFGLPETPPPAPARPA